MDDSFFKLVPDLMKVENLGIASPRKALSKTNKRAIDILEPTTKIVDGRYQIGLLWKQGAFLPNNRWLAIKQPDQLDQKLSKNPILKEKYQATQDADLEKGYVVKLHDYESLTDNVSSLPHHPATNENKPGKVRRVANASSIFQSQSLNSNLQKGPDLLSNLTGVIIRFRENRISLCADIEQMFMQEKVDPKDRPYLRFLWNNSGHIETYEYTIIFLVQQIHPA